MILKDRHINFFADTPCNNFKCSDRMKIAPPRKVAPAPLPAVPEGVSPSDSAGGTSPLLPCPQILTTGYKLGGQRPGAKRESKAKSLFLNTLILVLIFQRPK